MKVTKLWLIECCWLKQHREAQAKINVSSMLLLLVFFITEILRKEREHSTV